MNCDTCGIEIESESVKAECITATCGNCWSKKVDKLNIDSALIYRVFAMVNVMRPGVFLSDVECAKIIATIDEERGRE